MPCDALETPLGNILTEWSQKKTFFPCVRICVEVDLEKGIP
jgi:hypothetical protein